MPTIHTRYDYSTLPKPRVDFDAKKDKSLTNQADMDAADINKIMAKFEKTGVIIDQSGIERKPMYGDFSEVPNYHEALSAVRRTETAFNQLPVSIRNRFNNDPQEILNFLEDPKNDEEAVKWGLKDPDVLLTHIHPDGKTRISKQDFETHQKLAAEASASAASASGGAPITGANK